MFSPQTPNDGTELFDDLVSRQIPALLAELVASCGTPWGFSDFIDARKIK